MAGTSLFPFYDSLYGGALCELLARWRDEEGLSLRAIMDRIDRDTGHRPGKSSVARWLEGECE